MHLWSAVGHLVMSGFHTYLLLMVSHLPASQPLFVDRTTVRIPKERGEGLLSCGIRLGPTSLPTQFIAQSKLQKKPTFNEWKNRLHF